MTKKLLDRNKIVYSTVDMSDSDEAKQLVEQLGFKQAPVVVYDKFSWSGFQLDKINALRLLLLEHKPI
jgi:glutaredoxin-like protein NrdH